MTHSHSEALQDRQLGLREHPRLWPVSTTVGVLVAAGLVEGGKLTAVTVGGVGAQAHVACHQEAGEVLAQQTDGFDSRGVLGVCRGAPLILGTGEGQSGRTKSQEAFGRHSGQPPGHSPGPLLYHQPLDEEARGGPFPLCRGKPDLTIQSCSPT